MSTGIKFMVMSLHLNLFLLSLALFAEVGVSQNQWLESRCGVKGLPIRFPFHLKDSDHHHQPWNQHGYPGFELSCNGDKTVLELPDSVKFFVQKIDYKSQEIKVYDPDNCLINQLLKIKTISKSPFRFKDTSDWIYTLFNCSKESDVQIDNYYSSVTCLNGRNYSIYIASSDSTIEYMPPYCKKMYDTSPLPEYIIDLGNLVLSWSKD